MNFEKPKVYFYFPVSESIFSTIPENPNDFWKWLSSQKSITPMQSGGCFWTLQTYLYLKNSGYHCELVNKMPKEGIVLSHRDFLPDSFNPGSKMLLVCLRADVDRHPYAQLHIVQNPHQALPKKRANFWESYFIPHWPQPSIVPRNPERGDTFENVVFLGNEINLVPEFKDKYWYSQLEDLGLHFQKKLSHEEWNDYSDTDVVLAVRSFGRTNDWRGKPASKLYSAWHAGVPAILGYESAFCAERKSELDYLEATTLEEVITSIKLLKEDENLRRAVIQNGRNRAQETDVSNMVLKWQSFIDDVAVPAYRSWCALPKWRQLWFFKVREAFIASRPAYYFLKEPTSRFLTSSR